MQDLGKEHIQREIQERCFETKRQMGGDMPPAKSRRLKPNARGRYAKR